MNPWLPLWSLHLHFPFSGNVAQHIDPDNNWFFDSIKPSAGNSAIEREAFDIASYGKQLGLISELLLDMANSYPPTTPQGQTALARLQDIHSQIDALKTPDATRLMQDMMKLMQQWQNLHNTPVPALPALPSAVPNH